MSKTRVPKGEKYFFIRANNYLEFTTDSTFDVGCEANDNDFERGNYFLTERDAVNKIVQLNAVLKGAEVIEMPSEEEIQKVLAEKIPIHGGRTYGEALNCCWFEEGIHWLRDNKIVK